MIFLFFFIFYKKNFKFFHIFCGIKKMETKRCLIFFLIIGLMIFLLISFATKGAHWDKVDDKSSFEEQLPQVYRSLEGLIVVDVLMFFIFVPMVLSFFINQVTVLKVAVGLMAVLIFIRFILGIIFLRNFSLFQSIGGNGRGIA